NSAQKSGWSVIELKNKSHLEVAHLMQESLFFINTNCFESFNTTVPEAMAAGCITFCYEAFGGQDFLINEENAFVFPNNYVYPLLSKVLNIVNDLESYMEKIGRIQDHGLHTARQFEKSRTITELKRFYQKFGIIS
ncbi:MAG: glycosyltransferase, partial [Saprospiraceae bacterium]|nr:glycosyltransferase [Saprospiraceae bacterium]